MSLLYRLLCWYAGRLSLRQARRIGRALGWLAWVLRVRRRTAIDNITLALGASESEARQLARRAYAHLGCGAVEFLRVGALSPQQARRVVGAGSLDRLQQVLSRGRGALVLGAHLGNWDLLACAAGRCGVKVNLVTRRLKQQTLDRFWMGQRAACGVRLLPAVGSARAICAALRRNEVVAMVLDQHEPGGLVVPFLGRPAATGSALARLALATGTPIVPAFLLRTADGFALELPGELTAARTADRSHDVLDLTRRCTEVIECQVRRHPDQWLWLHRRWKVGHDPHGFGTSPDRSTYKGSDAEE